MTYKEDKQRPFAFADPRVKNICGDDAPSNPLQTVNGRSPSHCIRQRDGIYSIRPTLRKLASFEDRDPSNLSEQEKKQITDYFRKY